MLAASQGDACGLALSRKVAAKRCLGSFPIGDNSQLPPVLHHRVQRRRHRLARPTRQFRATSSTKKYVGSPA